MPVKVEILFLFLQVNFETALKNCPCSEFFLGTAARGEIPESFNECRHISAGSDQENPVGMCIPVIPALSVLLSGPGVWNLIFPLGATEQVLEDFGSWIPLQLIGHKSLEIESLVHSIFFSRRVPFGALPDNVDM